MLAMDVVIGEDGLARPAWAQGSGAHGELLRHYYDTEWGMPVRDERGLFERLSLEAFQSGLSWATILAKRESFRAAFAGFDRTSSRPGAKGRSPTSCRTPGSCATARRSWRRSATPARRSPFRADGGLVDLVWSHRPERTPMPRTFAEVPTTSDESRAWPRS